MRMKLIAGLLAPLLTNGCMMAGMAGMGGMGHMTGGGTHGGGAAVAADGTMEVSEIVAGGLRVSAEFPVQVADSSTRFAVVLRELDGRAITTDAAVFVDVTPIEKNSIAVPPVPTQPGHPATLSHPAPRDVALHRIVPYARSGGRFEFRSFLEPEGAFRVTVVVERVGERVMDPPISVSRMVQSAPHAAGDAHAANPRWGGYAVPLAVLGAGLMALMMLVAWR